MGAQIGGHGGNWESEDGGFSPVSDINVTPLVDVMLVLLIIFMVAAPLMTVGVPLQLPKTAAAKVAEQKDPTVVSIDKDGKVFLGEEELAQDSIVPRLAALAAQDPQPVVLVRGDREIPYGRIMEVMGQVSTAGFLKVSLIAEKAPGASVPPAQGAAPSAVAPAPVSTAPAAPAVP
ncbi:biopolymer transporter ExbD [Terrihabitans rhizophilus]|uniref:Biopolymer transporter ExbD n=1 Tax=Terrihabitans rhizophilus TaxID=3092662 RepID=A0ABU4RSE1_9HYPH|nr:biopolymer transporter ExbD [Terrihabitans sp. PJ23]MDX6806994.1 biopolymer transporter ExbD [Terrihabitans sp. PJ23]